MYNKKGQFKALLITFILCEVVVSATLFHHIDSRYYSVLAIITSAILALTAAFVGVFYQRQTAKEKNTLDFQSGIQSDKQYVDSMRKLATIFRDYDSSITIGDLANDLHVNKPESQAIRYVLNSWEKAANAIRHGIFDDNYLYSSHKSTVLLIGVKCRPFIRARQATNTSLYTNLNWLIMKWTIRRDSFEEQETKRAIQKIFKELDKVKSGKIPSHLK